MSCSICLLSFSGEYFRALTCGHHFCKDCWSTHFEIQIFQGITTSKLLTFIHAFSVLLFGFIELGKLPTFTKKKVHLLAFYVFGGQWNFVHKILSAELCRLGDNGNRLYE